MSDRFQGGWNPSILEKVVESIPIFVTDQSIELWKVVDAWQGNILQNQTQIMVLYICASCCLLAHKSHDLSQAETRINVVTSWANCFSILKIIRFEKNHHFDWKKFLWICSTFNNSQQLTTWAAFSCFLKKYYSS